MGLTKRRDEAASVHDLEAIEHFGMVPGPDASCFRCGGPITHPAIFWAGADGAERPIYLHGGCAVDLATDLLRDAKQLRGMESA